MAEGLFNAAAARAGLRARARSCGLSAFAGAPVTPEAARAAFDRGADITGHIAVRAEEGMAAGAACILCMTGGHAAALRRLFPARAARIGTLDDADIIDPFGRGEAAYQAAARQIADAVDRLVERLSREQAGA